MAEEPTGLVIEQTEWQWLKPHLERNAIFVVSLELNLLDVGQAVLKDSTHEVQNWIQKGLLTRPSLEQIQKWNATPQTLLSFLILQPYVLVQEKWVN